MAPTLSGVPAGVTVSNFNIGTGLGSVFDNGALPDAIRLSGNDGITGNTGAGFTNNAYFSFSVTIESGVTVSLESLGMDCKATNATNYLNARTFSSIRGHADAAGNTIGVLGRRTGGSDDAFVSSVINLVTPRSNAAVGGTIQNGDFTNLTGPLTVTFELPFITGTNAATTFIDIDNVTLTFVEGVVQPVAPLKVTDFRVLPDRSRVTFTGASGSPFAVMASADLTGPVYRKRWSVVGTGSFAGVDVVMDDLQAGLFPQRFYIVAPSVRPKARIMPVGDSITEGASSFSVYRPPLYDKLTAAGYHFEFVGSKSSTYSSPTGTVTLKHEGQGGANAQTVASNVAASFPNNPADIVLIHSGHNYNTSEATLDEAGKEAIATTVENATRNMIATCRATNPRVIVLVAQVITSNKLPKYAYIPNLNARLATMAASLSTAASPVMIVNQADGWDPAADTITDLVHPNAVGAEKMAVKWFAALSPLLE